MSTSPPDTQTVKQSQEPYPGAKPLLDYGYNQLTGADPSAFGSGGYGQYAQALMGGQLDPNTQLPGVPKQQWYTNPFLPQAAEQTSQMLGSGGAGAQFMQNPNYSQGAKVNGQDQTGFYGDQANQQYQDWLQPQQGYWQGRTGQGGDMNQMYDSSLQAMMQKAGLGKNRDGSLSFTPAGASSGDASAASAGQSIAAKSNELDMEKLKKIVLPGVDSSFNEAGSYGGQNWGEYRKLMEDQTAGNNSNRTTSANASASESLSASEYRNRMAQQSALESLMGEYGTMLGRSDTLANTPWERQKDSLVVDTERLGLDKTKLDMSNTAQTMFGDAMSQFMGYGDQYAKDAFGKQSTDWTNFENALGMPLNLFSNLITLGNGGPQTSFKTGSVGGGGFDAGGTMMNLAQLASLFGG